jgi:hypothetical protein
LGTGRSDVPARFIPFLAFVLDAEVTDFLPSLDPRQVNELVRGRIVGIDKLRTSYTRNVAKSRRLMTRKT